MSLISKGLVNAPDDMLTLLEIYIAISERYSFTLQNEDPQLVELCKTQLALW